MTADRVGSRMFERLVHGLSERDLDVVRTVADFRLATAVQLQRLHFEPTNGGSALTAARTSRRVLQRLTDHRLLARLERRVGGIRAGSASYIYAPGQLAARLLDPEVSRVRLSEPSPWFVDHTLAVTELYVLLIEAERRSQLDLLEVEPEPQCWRQFTASHAGTAILKPDLFVSLGVGDVERRFFCEIDLATEHAPTLQRKASAYLNYLRSGREQAEHSVFPVVAWQVPNPARRERVERALASVAAPAGLFIVFTPGQAIEVLGGES